MSVTNMKKLLLTSIIAILAAIPALGKRDETITLRVGQQKTAMLGKIKVRFVAIDSDSRCPAGVTCIWAGNARVRITVSRRHKGAKTFELNSTLEPRTVTYEGYDITFVDLTRAGEEPGGKVRVISKDGSKTRAAAGALVLSITRSK